MFGRLIHLAAGYCVRSATVVMGLLAGMAAHAAPVCGPGPHWVEACGAGVDTFDSLFQFAIATPLPTSLPILVDLNGPTTVRRLGGTTVPDHHFDTEILDALGSGVVAGLGRVTLRIGTGEGVATPSGGRVTEQAGDSTRADSFFDVFFELDLPDIGPPGGLHLFNSTALRLHAEMLCAPPNAHTPSGQRCVDSYTADLGVPLALFLIGNPGAPVAFLVDRPGGSHHTPIDEPATLLLLLTLGLIPLAARRRR